MERRVIVTLYDELYYRLEFEHRSNAYGGHEFEWTKDWANVMAHESQLEVYVANYIRTGRVTNAVKTF